MKRALFYVLYLPFSMVCLLLLAELGLRLFAAPVPGFVSFEFHPDRAGDFAPNRHLTDTLIKGLPYTVTTNSQGLRATRELAPAGSGAVRVLCLGDSFTFGVGVNDSEAYPAQLEAMLRAKYPGREIEVVNAGMPFFDVVDELDYWEQKGRALKPDLVICQFYYNDVQTMNGESFRREARAKAAPYSAFRQMLKQSRIYAAATTAAYELFKARMLPARVQPVKPADPWYEGRYCPRPSDEEAKALDSGVLDQASLETLACRWGKYYEGLLALRSSVEASGARFLFLMAPDETQVRQERLAPSAYLNPRLARDGVAAIDLLPAFRAAFHQDGVPLYNSPYDFHANRAGNTVVAILAARAIALKPEGGVELAAAPWYGFGHVSRVGLAVKDGGLAIQGDDGELAGDWSADARIHVQGLQAATNRAEITTYEDTPGVAGLVVASRKPRTYFELTLHPQVFNDEENGGLKAYLTLDGGPEQLVLDRSGSSSGDDAYFYSVYTPGKPFTRAELRFVVGKGTGLVIDKYTGKLPGRMLVSMGY
ncbi:GDSL-type esterase/lipase family protein [Fundidesulfovibrio agrisoli]|uniref:GDSL-type esterase/lipase family protein n=1 Tax=Fundidesulfovibrio agrisoli TaxID=2922717 RepID=UPI001FACD269|nr:GDSL-type esterase/lipase family protein [Fundidesulfovibrio agrisoli]